MLCDHISEIITYIGWTISIATLYYTGILLHGFFSNKIKRRFCAFPWVTVPSSYLHNYRSIDSILSNNPLHLNGPSTSRKFTNSRKYRPRLTWVYIFCTCIKSPFLRAWIISTVITFKSKLQQILPCGPELYDTGHYLLCLLLIRYANFYPSITD